MVDKNTTTNNQDLPTMTREWHVELNAAPGEAHVQLRCVSLEQATEYIQRLFPKSYVKQFDPITNYVFFERDAKNANDAIGIITEVRVPNTWVSNRRLTDQELERQAA